MAWRTRTGLLLLLPAVLWIAAFTLYPLVQSFWYSLHRMRLGRPTSFYGLGNYVDIFSDDRVRGVVGVSLFLSAGGLVATVTLGVFMAWLFNRNLPGLRVLRAILTMPLFAAPVAVAFAGIAIFNETSGPVNRLIRALGGDGVLWLSDPAIAPLTVLITDTWQWTPFVFILVLAAMQSIPDDLYEAARLETGSEAAIFFRITLPLISPAIATVAILRLVETFKILDIPLNLTAGGPGSATQTYSYYTYISGLRSFNIGYGSALSYLLVVVCIVVTTLYFRLLRRRVRREPA